MAASGKYRVWRVAAWCVAGGAGVHGSSVNEGGDKCSRRKCSRWRSVWWAWEGGRGATRAAKVEPRRALPRLAAWDQLCLATDRPAHTLLTLTRHRAALTPTRLPPLLARPIPSNAQAVPRATPVVNESTIPSHDFRIAGKVRNAHEAKATHQRLALPRSATEE